MGSLRNAIAALFLVLPVWYAVLQCLAGFGAVVPIGATFDLRSGAVISVQSGSVAAAAGVRLGDRADFSRGGWPLHLSLDRFRLTAGQHFTLPLIRDGVPLQATLVGPHAKPPTDAVNHFVSAILALLYTGLGLALYFLRRNTSSLVFLCYACCAMSADNLAMLWLAPPAWMPFAMLVPTAFTTTNSFALLYFSFVFANQSPRAKSIRRYVLYPAVATLFALYYVHFYTLTVWDALFDTYTVYSALACIIFVAAAATITIRVNWDVAVSRRLRWIVLGVWTGVLIQGAFFIEQNLAAVAGHPLQGATPIFLLNTWLKPGVCLFCFGYALMQTRIVDVRIVGARALVYGLLTAIPIGLFSAVEWLFARELSDARLATFVEFGVAILFGVWLRTLHKRIDRFVERIVFAARHHAFSRLRHAIHALSSVDRSETAISMVSIEPADALHLGSAAVFVERDGIFERCSSIGWDSCATQLQSDDSLVLFARSERKSIRLNDVTPSASNTPRGDAEPELAIPITAHHRTIAVALFGRHSTGEHLDTDEEELLTELSHAAGAALERLESVERVRELEAENALLTKGIRV